MTDMYQRHQQAPHHAGPGQSVPPQRRAEAPYPLNQAAPPVQTRTKTIIIPPRDGRAMTVLRATAYVLTSLASLLFIAVVVYGVIQLGRAQSALEDLYGGIGTPSFDLPATPDPLAPPPGG
ncbi:hypothetical protein ACVGOW_31810 [Pseudonocardia saturnea]